MKEMKRTIAALLASLMMMSSVSIPAFGAESMTAEQALVVAKVGAAGIMTGTDLGFEGEKTLTRAEAAAIMVRMKGIDESVVKASAGETLFTDVAAGHWAAGYINVASSQGIIKGVGAGNFAPDTVVTVAEFTTMAVRALGAGTLVDSMGTWPTNYMNFANEEKLTEDVYKIYTAPAARIDAATIAANTLEADVWEKRQVTNTNEVTYAKIEDKTILSDTLDIVKYENVKFSEISTKDREVTFITGYTDDTTPEAISGTFDVADGVDLATLKAGISYDVWYDKATKVKEVVGIWKAEDAKEKTEFFTGVVDVDTTDKNKKITLLVDGEEEEFEYADATEVVLNGNEFTVAELEACEDAFGTILIEGSEIKKVFGEMFTNKRVVKEIKNDTIYFETTDVKGAVATDGSSIDLDDEYLEFAVLKNGKEIKVTDIEEGDALYFYKDGDKYSILVNNTSVSGVVTSVSTSYAKIDGKKFELTSSTDGVATDAAELTAGDEIKAYIDSKGRLAMFEELEGAAGDLAVVTSLRETTNKFGEDAVEIELTQLDGTVLPIKEIDLDETKEEISAVTAITDVDDLLGTVVRFNDSKDGYVIEEMMDITPETENAAATGVSSDTDSDKEDVINFLGNVGYNEDSMKLDSKYRLTDSTKVVVIKEGDKAYEKEISVVNVEDLGDIEKSNLSAYKTALDAYNTAVADLEASSTETNKNAVKTAKADLAKVAPVNAYIMGIDKNTDVVDTVVFASDVNRSTDNNYAVVVETGSIDSDDYETEVTLLLMDGTEVTLKSEETGFVNGSVITYSKEDDVLTDFDAVVGAAAVTGYVLRDNTDTLKVRVVAADADDTADDVLDIVSDAIYYSVDEKEEIAKAKAGDITQISDEVDTLAELTGKETLCVFITATNSDTQEEEIVAIKMAKGDGVIAEEATVTIPAITVTGTKVADIDVDFGTLPDHITADFTVTSEVDADTTLAVNDEITVIATYTFDDSYGLADTATVTAADATMIGFTAATANVTNTTKTITVKHVITKN